LVGDGRKSARDSDLLQTGVTIVVAVLVFVARAVVVAGRWRVAVE
jgi:hypothetical protein